MIKAKYLTVLLFTFLFVAVAAQAQSIETLDFDGEYTNISLPVGHWYRIWDTFAQGDTVSGYFETHAENMGLDFFICDQTNMYLWGNSSAATLYNSEDDMHTLSWEFTIPYAGVWYCVCSNRDGSTTVGVDIGWDKNSDNMPYYDPAEYDITGYAQVLEPGEFYQIADTYYAGTKIDGWYETFFPTDGVDFFICDDANYNIWYSGGSANVFAQEVDMHVANIDAFTIPTTGVWHILFIAKDEADTVTMSFGLIIDTSAAVTTSTGSNTGELSASSPLVVGMATGGIVLIILLGAILSRRGKGGPSDSVEHVVIPPSSPSYRRGVQPTQDREITTRVLVICPFCGAKNEQGVLKCQNCGADL